MGNQQSHGRKARLAGFFAVLAMHGAVLYSLWQYRVLGSSSEASTVFVELLKDSPAPELRKPVLPKARPATLDRRRRPAPTPQQLVAPAPVAFFTEPVATPPPPVLAGIEAPAEPAAPPKPDGPLVLSGGLAVSCPQRTPPDYPSISRRLGEEGKAVLRVELDQSGQIDHATIKSSSGYARLDEAALSAVRHWRCNPAMRDGIAVRAVAIQPFNFVLEGR